VKKIVPRTKMTITAAEEKKMAGFVLKPEGIVQSVEHERYLPLTVSTRLHFCDPNYS
jgi:hypothetical protein